MSFYTKLTDFAIKDLLPTGSPNKAIIGAELNQEFDAVKVAVDTMTRGYARVHNFRAKDLLTTGNPNKLVIGSQLDDEFDAIDEAFDGIAGWTYTRITTFALEEDVLGLDIDNEFNALGVALLSIWEAHYNPINNLWRIPYTLGVTRAQLVLTGQSIALLVPSTPIYTFNVTVGNNGGTYGYSGGSGGGGTYGGMDTTAIEGENILRINCTVGNRDLQFRISNPDGLVDDDFFTSVVVGKSGSLNQTFLQASSTIIHDLYTQWTWAGAGVTWTADDLAQIRQVAFY